MNASAEEVAQDVLETVPLVMRTLQAEMRQRRQPGLNVPQFRTLTFLKSQPGAALNEVAEHLGLTPATTSKLIDGLVAQSLIERREAETDRRRVKLTLTPMGYTVWETAFRGTQTALAWRFAQLADADRNVIRDAMQILRPLF